MSGRNLFLLLVAVVSLAGCSSKKTADGQPVSGSVSANGKPITRGMILFNELSPDEGAVGRSVEVVILDGKYAIPEENGPAAGANSVEVTIIGKPTEGEEDEEDMLAGEILATFNTKWDVPEGGDDSMNFDLGPGDLVRDEDD